MRKLQIFLSTILNSSLELGVTVFNLIVLDRFYIIQKDMLLCVVNKKRERELGEEGREKKEEKKEGGQGEGNGGESR